MRYLRMLSNAAIAAALASVYLTTLVLHLNPSYPAGLLAAAPLAGRIAAIYGTTLAVLFFAAMLARQLIAHDRLSPGWISVRVLSWLCTGTAAAAAVLMWLNLDTYAPVLEPQTVTRLGAAAVALSASAGVFCLIALAHLGRRGGRTSAVLLTAMMALSAAVPLGLRGAPAARPLGGAPFVSPLAVDLPQVPGRVVLLVFDGASLDVISPAVAEGHLPHFGRMLDTGAVLHLATLRPTQTEPVWSAALTGRHPAANGIRASALYRIAPGGPALEVLPDYCFAQVLVWTGLVEEEAHGADALLARPLWRILGDSGISVSVIGFPVTHPAPSVNGFLVSDEFHRLTNAARPEDAGRAISPPTLLSELRAALARAISPDPEVVLASLVDTPRGADARPDPAPVVGDRMHLQILRALHERAPTQFVAARFPGLDAVAHYFLRYANPSAFGDVSEDERRHYGRVLPDYYGFVDAIVGETLERLQPGDLLLVASGFGMEPLSPGKRVLERIIGDSRISGSHERAPDGFLLAYGSAVAAGRRDRASLVDLTPTLLYYLGLPVGRDMDGFARTDLFQPSFTASRPVTFIPTYGR